MDDRPEGFLARLLARSYGPGEVWATEPRRHEDRRFTTSKLLPRILAQKVEGLTRRQTDDRLGLSKRQVEQVLRRWRDRDRS